MPICEQDGCGKKTRNTKYCSIHRCTKKGCDKYAISGFGRCKVHTKQCKLCVDYTNRTYCKRHECKVDKCYKAQIKYFELCEIHKCTKYDCINQSLTDEKFCKLHLCTVKGCCEANLPHKNHCKSHTCLICGDFYPYSSFEDYLLSGRVTQYCSKHSCDICGHDADNVITVKGRKILVCSFHDEICNKIDCTNTRLHDTTYCPEHKCFFDKCVLYAENDILVCVGISIAVCEYHTQYAFTELKNNRNICFDRWQNCNVRRPVGKYCKIINCMNKAISKHVFCIDHYWMPKCLYCLTDGKCAKSCSHKCEIPCTDGRCSDPLYMRKHRTKHNYYLLSRTKFIADSAPVFIPQIARIVAEYLW